MAVYVLDTTITSLLEAGHPPTVAQYQAHAADTILVTSNTIEESFNGWMAQLRRARTNAQRAAAVRSLVNSTSFLFRFKILAMAEPMYDRFDQLVKLKLNIGSMDLKIAACGLELSATVATQNVRDFRRVPGLLWEDWTQ